jgi:hypothetical protein
MGIPLGKVSGISNKLLFLSYKYYSPIVIIVNEEEWNIIIIQIP